MEKIQYSNQLSKNELQDLLENIGVLQEVNRTFFNPIGLELVLNKDLNLELHSTQNKKGIILHTIDRFKLLAFNNFRNEKHKERQQQLGFIIQTQDMIRKDKLEEDENINLSIPENLKLKKLLRCVDSVAYAVKKRFMENSKEKDSYKNMDIPFKKVTNGINFDIEQGKFTDAIAKLIIINSEEDIKNEIEKIKKIKKEQDKIFREKKLYKNFLIGNKEKK